MTTRVRNSVTSLLSQVVKALETATICWCNASLLSMVVSRFEALVGMSAIVGSQLALSDFFFGLGAGVAEEESGVAVVSTLTFFLNFTGCQTPTTSLAKDDMSYSPSAEGNGRVSAMLGK